MAVITLNILINLRSLIILIIPISLITSVMLRILISQSNSNHSLGVRGLRTWPCVDATQTVTLVGV
jgi:hypothetical protein